MQTPGDVATAAIGNDHRISRDCTIDNELHFSLIAGIDDDIGDSRDVAGTYSQQISQALAVRVNKSIKVIFYSILSAHSVD